MSDRTCSIESCNRAVKVKYRGWCWTHYKRWQKYGSPNVVLPWPGSGIEGEDSPRWKGDECGYFAAHQRIWKLRGRAADQICVGCGNQASQWAYDYTDPSPLHDERGCPYSTDATRYQPMCAACHKRFDLAHSEVADGQPVRGVQEAP